MIFQVQPESQCMATACVVLAEMLWRTGLCFGRNDRDMAALANIHDSRRVGFEGSMPLEGSQALTQRIPATKKDALRRLLHRVGGPG